MTEIRNEIMAEVTKIYKTRFTHKIENFPNKLNEVSCFIVEIPGLAKCLVELHPNQRKNMASGAKFVKLVIKMDAPNERKHRHVKVEIRTTQDICIWVDEFEYTGRTERSKDEFMNQYYLKSYVNDNVLSLDGVITVKENHWNCAAADSCINGNQKLFQDIQSLAVSGTLTDFIFVVEGRELEVHKTILAARSPVFEKMFTGNWSEATARKQEIKDISADTFEEFLYFIYAGKLRNVDFPVAELILVADRYQVTDLLNVCEVKLLENINDDNAEAVYRLANRIQCNKHLKETSFQLLQTNFNRLTVKLPSDFLDSPEKVFSCLDLQKKLLGSVATVAAAETSAEVQESLSSTAISYTDLVLNDSQVPVPLGRLFVDSPPSFFTASVVRSDRSSLDTSREDYADFSINSDLIDESMITLNLDTEDSDPEM